MDSKTRSVPHIPLANVNPLRSFRSFMYRQPSDITPEEAHSLYTRLSIQDEITAREMERHDAEVTRRFFEYYRDEEWMTEKYVPTRRLQRLRDRASEILDLHKKLSDFVLSGKILQQDNDSMVKDSMARRIRDDIVPACV